MKRLAVLLIALLWAAQNLWAATHPWFPDALSEGLNLKYSVEAYEGLIALFEGKPGALGKLTWQGFPYGPPLYVSAAIAEWVTGTTEPWARLVPVQIAGLMALFGTFVIGRRLASPTAGLWAAGLLATAPMFTYYARHFTTDLLLTALCVWSLVFALHSRGFARTGPTLAFGAVFGLAVMTKPAAPQLLFAPLVGYFGWTVLLGRAFPGGSEAAKSLGDRLRGAMPRLVAAGLLALLVSWPYVRHLLGSGGQANLDRFQLGPGAAWGVEPRFYYPRLGDEGWLHWLTFYPRMLVRYQVGLVLSALLFGLSILACRRRQAGAIWALLAFVATLLLYTGMAAKKWYYTLPALPLLAIAAGIGAERIRGARFGAVLLVGLWAHAAWIGGSGLVWNRPPLLQVAPAPPAEDPQLPVQLARELLASTTPASDVLILSPVQKKVRPHPRNLAISSLESQLQYLVLAPGRQVELGGIDEPDQLRRELRGGVDWLLFESPDQRTWLPDDTRLLQLDPSLRGPLGSLRADGELRVFGSWHGWTIRLLRYEPRFRLE